jgi:cytochrome P450
MKEISAMSQVTQRAPTEEERLAWYRRMRDAEPVWRDPKTGLWSLFRYEDVAAALADHRTFSSDFGRVMPEERELMEGAITAMDPPRHNRLRSLVSQAFTPRAIAALEGRIAGLTEELLDQAGARTRLELVSDLAYPLPVIVIAELLGVPAEDRPKFKEWADAMFSRDNVDPHDKQAMERSKADLNRFRDYLRGHVDRRRAEPRADLLTDLTRAEIDGQRLTDDEIVTFGTILLIAGHVTTTALLGNAVRCLHEHPEVQDALRADAERLPSAIEEVLRFRSPFAVTSRVTTTEVRLGDVVIPPEQMVSVWLQSANRDERQFADPDRFVMDRQPNPHLAFGKGIHFCLGAPLARLESRVALGILLRRYARLGVDPDQPLEPFENPGFNAVKALHLVVEPA